MPPDTQPGPSLPKYFRPEPISASTLAAIETQRRDTVRRLGPCRSGCKQLDDYVLLGGGLERGCVVGISAEDEDGFGVVLGLQVLVCSLLDGVASRALVVTPKPANALLVPLRNGITAKLAARGVVSAAEVASERRRCLDSVMLSCVFDMDGLCEVLADLDRPVVEEERRASGVSEIRDSEGEDEDEDEDEPASAAQDIIVVTHFSALLTSLFTHRERSAAHTALQLLASRLRHLSRALPSHPLILLLNSTDATAESHSRRQNPATNPPPASAATATSASTSTSIDPTLRSIFNPPLPPAYSHCPQPGAAAAAAHRRVSRTNKPSFGLVFAQLLDLHLLCTRVPRTAREAGDASLAAATVVEVLLDDMGLWEGKRGGRRRREQRWAVLDVRGSRVMDAPEME